MRDFNDHGACARWRCRVVRLGLRLLVATSLVTRPATAQIPLAEHTLASRGAKVGAAVGGILGGLLVGVASAGLCDAADCGGSFLQGAAIGALGGAALGGAGGTILGAAFPADGRRLARRRVTAGTGGSVFAGFGNEATGPWLRAALLDGTTTHVGWGVELAWAGRYRRVPSEEPGTDPVSTSSRTRSVWLAGLLAVRDLGGPPERGPYGVLSVGVYPVRETVTFIVVAGDGQTSGSEQRDRTLKPYPGLGLGVGGSWPMGGALHLVVEARAHLVSDPESTFVSVEVGVALP